MSVSPTVDTAVARNRALTFVSDEGPLGGAAAFQRDEPREATAESSLARLVPAPVRFGAFVLIANVALLFGLVGQRFSLPSMTMKEETSTSVEIKQRRERLSVYVPC